MDTSSLNPKSNDSMTLIGDVTSHQMKRCAMPRQRKKDARCNPTKERTSLGEGGKDRHSNSNRNGGRRKMLEALNEFIEIIEEHAFAILMAESAMLLLGSVWLTLALRSL